MPNRGLARKGLHPAETSAGTLQPRGPGWQLDRRGNACGRGMVIHGGRPPGQNPAYRPSARFPLGMKAEGGLAPAPPLAALPQGIWAKMKPMPPHLGANTRYGAKRRRPRRRPERLAPHGARFDCAPVVWLLTLLVPQVKGGLQEISRGPCVSPMQERRLWRNRRRSRSV